MVIAALHDLIDPAAARRIVLKIGSSLLVDGAGCPRAEWLESIAGEIADFRAAGREVVVVSSGAIALGAARLGLERGGRGSLADAQAAASVGQIALASLWSEKLAARGLTAAQLLLTLDDLEDRRRYLNASSTLARLLESGAVPVVNENDSVATQEIRFGDNDRLAARVAQAVRADAVLLLSDVDGLFDRNPREAGARLVPVVDGIDDAVRAMADGGSASGLGSGGMTSKLQAAEIAERAGIALAIVNGTHRAPIGRALEGGVGTVFLPRRRDGARKAWLGGRLRDRGALVVDVGCAAALAQGGSLLAAGITAVEGAFERGDLVAIRDPAGAAIARGLAEYGAAECHALKGLRSADHARVLGYAPRAAVVHRDHMVML
ncbi:glutamate 5-kinase [Pelagerythrobacter marensis]|uniref:Glutamate 5-kinase n=1 Tax=Pelagerythrobacter marensis TaxID=543877 RepID=A0A0G3X5V4_9SPHN|nr:glutamate 5-kinase [Pelagerythrobacter marensis]AKM06537.1 Glutamate 5-kinase [Pelagerythrobacter marensis]